MGNVISIAEKVRDYLVNSITKEIGERVVSRVQEHVGYVIDYDSNMRTLKTEADKLGVIQKEVQHSVDVAKMNGQCIVPGVESWLTNVNHINEKVKKFLEDEATVANKRWLGGLCPDLISRYKLSWEAKKKTQDVTGIQAENTWLDYADFESRMLIMEEIMAALKDANINVIGICGLGGVGKTTMVEKVRERAKAEKLFDEIAMAVVTQTPNLKKIQDEIARKLDLQLIEKDDSRERAVMLRNKLMDCRRRLVILDDVWERLDLEAVGIPVGGVYKGCKVILTSRSQGVCERMGTLQNFTIGVLSEQEAWSLFKHKAGDSVDSPDLNQIAKAVVKECGGLPIVIVTVGASLKGKKKPEWRDALQQLKKSNPENISEMLKRVYPSIMLSYDFLESQQVKSLLLLCCLFEEDANIEVEDLVKYGMGLDLFKGIDTLAKARDRMYTLVGTLKGSYLLLEGYEEKSVRVHDVVRDVIRFMATQGKQTFMFSDGRELKEWPTESRDEQYSSLSLISNEIHQLPDRLDCPKLELLLLECTGSESLKAPDDLFEGMKELKVLNLGRVKSPSLSVLMKLQTLCLHRCQLENISSIGELKTLVILSFRKSSIKELPREIGNLTHLRLLDLTECFSLEKITPGVISSLKQLEELYLGNSGLQWVVEKEEGNGENKVNLVELLSLSNLTALETCLPTVNFPRGVNPFGNLTRFGIVINPGEDPYWYREHEFRNELTLNLDSEIPIDNWINVLLGKTETLCLTLKGVKNVLDDLIPESLIQLKYLSLRYCEGLKYLIDRVDLVPDNIFPNLESLKIHKVDNLKMIFHGKLPMRSFTELRRLNLYDLPKLMHLWEDHTEVVSLRNLTHVVVQKCDKLENLFSQSIASGLEQLELLQIESCKKIKEIFATKRREHGKVTYKIRFPKLSELTLVKLPNIIGFGKNMDGIEFPQLSTLHLESLPKLRSFFPNNLASKGNHDTASQHLFNEKVKSLCELRSMEVHRCDKLLNIFSSNLVQSLQNLEKLTIYNCNLLEVIFDFEGLIIEEGRAALALSCLTYLDLASLPKLTHLWKKPPLGIQAFQKLQSVEVQDCRSLKNIFTPSIAKLLVKLEELCVHDCAVMEIVGKDQEGGKENEEATKVIVFPKLHHLRLKNLPDLVSFGPKPYTFKCPMLKKLTLKKVNMKVFIPEFLGVRKQRTISVRSHEEVHEQQIMFPGLEVLTLGGEDDVEVILDDQLLAQSFCKLREIRVEKCNELLVVPSNLLLGLQKLEGLTIRYCFSDQQSLYEIVPDW